MGGLTHLLHQTDRLRLETKWQDFQRRCGLGKSQDLVQARGYGFRKRLSLQETLLPLGRAGGECKGQSSWGLGQERKAAWK